MMKTFFRKLFGAGPESDIGKPAVMAPEDAQCLIDGKAISIKHVPLLRPMHLMSGDVLRVTVSVDDDPPFIHNENIGEEIDVDTIAVFRVRDALGFKHAIGALIGERDGP